MQRHARPAGKQLECDLITVPGWRSLSSPPVLRFLDNLQP